MAHMQLEVEKEMKKKTANKNIVSACNIWQEKHVHALYIVFVGGMGSLTVTTLSWMREHWEHLEFWVNLESANLEPCLIIGIFCTWILDKMYA